MPTSKPQKLARAFNGVVKQRARLGDLNLPPPLIRRPFHMRCGEFNRRIAILERHLQTIEQLAPPVGVAMRYPVLTQKRTRGRRQNRDYRDTRRTLEWLAEQRSSQ